MDQKPSSPLLENGGFFVGINNRPRADEPTVSFPQAVMAGIVLACFAAGVLLMAAGVS